MLTRLQVLKEEKDQPGEDDRRGCKEPARRAEGDQHGEGQSFPAIEVKPFPYEEIAALLG